MNFWEFADKHPVVAIILVFLAVLAMPSFKWDRMFTKAAETTADRKTKEEP